MCNASPISEEAKPINESEGKLQVIYINSSAVTVCIYTYVWKKYQWKQETKPKCFHVVTHVFSEDCANTWKHSGPISCFHCGIFFSYVFAITHFIVILSMHIYECTFHVKSHIYTLVCTFQHVYRIKHKCIYKHIHMYTNTHFSYFGSAKQDFTTLNA